MTKTEIYCLLEILDLVTPETTEDYFDNLQNTVNNRLKWTSYKKMAKKEKKEGTIL